MELRLELALSISNKMAIPLVVPAEYGPLPANNNNNGQQQRQLAAQAQPRRARGPIDRNNNTNHVLNLNQRNQNHGPDLLNHVEGNNVEQQNNPLGFLAQLMMELWTVFSGEQPRRPRLEAPRNRGKQSLPICILSLGVAFMETVQMVYLWRILHREVILFLLDITCTICVRFAPSNEIRLLRTIFVLVYLYLLR